MGRPRSFDLDQAVHAAMLTFWRRGWAATGVRDLCGAMGVQPGSFYAAFGSKGQLFRQVLDHYVRTLALPEPGPRAVVTYLDGIIAEREPRGCLLAVSAVHAEALDDEARAALDDGRRRLEAYLARCLDDTSSLDPRGDARWLATLAWGLHLRHRAGEGPDRLAPIVDRTLRILDISRATE